MRINLSSNVKSTSETFFSGVFFVNYNCTMINNFKKPNLKGPRYREKRLGLLNKKTISEFKEKKPLYSSIDDSKLKKIIKLYNKNL